MTDDLPIYRVAGITRDGGTSTTGGNDLPHATRRFETMRDSGEYVAVYMFGRGLEGRVDESRAVRAWVKTASYATPYEWKEGPRAAA